MHTDQRILKSIWNHICQAQNPKAILRRKNKPGGITLSDFGQYYKATITKTALVLAPKHTNGSMKQNREPRNKLIHLQLIFDKGGKNIQ